MDTLFKVVKQLQLLHHLSDGSSASMCYTVY